MHLSDEVEFDIVSGLKAGYRQTYPIEFGGRRWWLTDEEMQHLRLLQQYFPETWEDEVYKRMDTLSLGRIKRDNTVQLKIK